MIYAYEHFLDLLDYYRDNARWERRERKREAIKRMIPATFKSRIE